LQLRGPSARYASLGMTLLHRVWVVRAYSRSGKPESTQVDTGGPLVTIPLL
jgi:hypothetical protein